MKQAKSPLPLISVVITSYNYGKYLQRAIESVQQQDYPNLEIIVADDASTDNSVAITKSIAGNDPRVRLLERKERVGLAKNKNAACHQAKGEFLSFLDADDFYSNPDKLSREYEVIRTFESEHDGTCVAFSLVKNVLVGNKRNVEKIDTHVGEGDIFHQMIRPGTKFKARDFLVRTQVFKDVGGFDENAVLYVDWILKIRLSRRVPFFCTFNEGITSIRHSKGMASQGPRVHRRARYYAYYSHRHLIQDWPARLHADYDFWRFLLKGSARRAIRPAKRFFRRSFRALRQLASRTS